LVPSWYRENIVKHDVSDLLGECRITKAELAVILGVHPVTVYGWKDGAPQYAVAYLKKHKRVLDLEESLARFKALVEAVKGGGDGK